MKRTSSTARGVAVTLLLVAAVPALFTGWLHPRRPDWSRLSPEVVGIKEAKAWPVAPLWIDVRPAEAFHRDHLHGAISVSPGGPWEESLAKVTAIWAPPQPIVVYGEGRYDHVVREMAERLSNDLNETVFMLREDWREGKEPVR